MTAGISLPTSLPTGDVVCLVSIDDLSGHNKERDHAGKYHAELSTYRKALWVFFDNGTIETFDIEENVVDKLLAKRNDSEGITYLSSEDMTFELSGKNHDITLVLEEINILDSKSIIEENINNNKGNLNERFVSGYVLIRKR